jgi:membrane associated rhomboid family serine protease
VGKAPDLLITVRTTQDGEAAREWVLVLSAADIPSRLANAEGIWSLAVDPDQAETAGQELEAFELEKAGRAREPAPPLQYGPTRAGLVPAVALVAFFIATGPYDPTSRWHQIGAASAEAVLEGEVWRVTTALVLHADLPHLLTNAVSAGVFTTLLFQALGPGLGACLLVLSGSLGNLANAWIQGPAHVAVGASTALFGAVGVLSGLQFARRWRLPLHRRGAWLPLAAGLALLAMLGTSGERTDVSAHLGGLVCGVLLGAPVAFVLTRPPGRVMQYVLGVAALCAVMGAWVVATWT